LLKVFAAIKGILRPPVFITQHMPPTFTAMLAEQLGRLAGVPAFEGQDGMSVSPGAIYGDALLNGPVAPGEGVDQNEIDRLFAD
jgi:chemotaxis response regulator CheB